LRITVSATSVRKVLLEEGLQPAPERSHSSWRAFLRAQAASMLACDFLTVETAFLQRIYVLFFISLATRRIEYIAASSNPDGRWVAQQARNLSMQLGDQHSFRLLIHDRDTKFSHAFDEILRTEGIKVIRTPIQAPNANAHAERWVRTLRADCLDRILILGRRHLEHVLRVYRRHYNEHRPHARSTFYQRTAATQRRRSQQLGAPAVATYLAASSTNTRPPEFANPTGASALGSACKSA
jgi:putative transposase